VAFILAAVVAAWNFGLAVAGDAALDECSVSAPSRAGVGINTHFDGWTWTCVYDSGATEFERPGPSVGDYIRRAVG